MRTSGLTVFKRLLLVGACFLPAAPAFAIVYAEVDYEKGVSVGMEMAADYVDTNAADWTTDFDQKSDAEFQLVAMEQSYVLGTGPAPRTAASYVSGVVAGIQNYITQMNSVGIPVWFTNGPTVPVSTAVTPHVAQAPRARLLIDAPVGRRPAQ